MFFPALVLVKCIAANTIYNILGALDLQSFKSDPPVLAFNYPDKLLAITVHEFGHSFVNPAVDKVAKNVFDQTSVLYAQIKEVMSSKGYITWNTCLNEHFVRAGEVMIARELGQNERAKELMEGNIKGGFCYLPQILKQLEIYSAHKELYSSYDAYIAPVIQNLQLVNNQTK